MMRRPPPPILRTWSGPHAVHLHDAPSFAPHPYVVHCDNWAQRGDGTGGRRARSLRQAIEMAKGLVSWDGDRACRVYEKKPVGFYTPEEAIVTVEASRSGRPNVTLSKSLGQVDRAVSYVMGWTLAAYVGLGLGAVALASMAFRRRRR